MATGGDLDRFNRNAASRRAVTRDALKSSRTWQFIWKFGEPDEISCWLNGLGNAWKITGTLIIQSAEDRKGRWSRKEKKWIIFTLKFTCKLLRFPVYRNSQLNLRVSFHSLRNFRNIAHRNIKISLVFFTTRSPLGLWSTFHLFFKVLRPISGSNKLFLFSFMKTRKNSRTRYVYLYETSLIVGTRNHPIWIVDWIEKTGMVE